jgi:peptidoglycan/xylan/chitin deacetylase (PgdA/CDA1 family)
MILLYHRVVADDAPEGRFWNRQTLGLSVFRKHLALLTRRFRMVSLEEYMAERHPWQKRLAVLTIDDGLWRTFQLVFPELSERRLQATVFLPTAHFDRGGLYWFTYLDALCFESNLPRIGHEGVTYSLDTEASRRRCRQLLARLAKKDGRPADFTRAMNQRYPIEETLLEEYRAMRQDEVRAAVESGYVQFGCHTVTHPYLDTLPAPQQFEEISGSREMLRKITGTPVPYLAYPAGAYNRDSVAAAKAAGFSAAFACVPNRHPVDSRFEIGRIGMYSPSIPKLVAKTLGAAHLLRALDIAAG